MGEPINYLTLTDTVIRDTTMPPGKAQHYLHDDKLPGLALRMRATGGRTWVYLFTKPGVRGTQRKTLGAWPRFNERAARKAATITAGEVVTGVDPNDAKREAKRQQLAEMQRTTLVALISEDGPYQTSLTGRQVVNWKPAMSALRRGPPSRHMRANCPKPPSLPDACQTLMISSSISARPFVRRPTLCARVSFGAR